MKKRFLSILLAICMVLTTLPFPALAADGFTDDGTEIIPTICDTQGHDWSRHDGICAREDCDAQCVHEKWADGVCTTCGCSCPHTECIDDGPDGCLHYYSCAVCDYRYTVPCHDWSGLNGVCAREGCGAVCAHETWMNGACATCGMSCDHSGNTNPHHCIKPTLCSVCGTALAPIGSHSYNVTEAAATCTTDGTRTYTCSVCGHSYTEITCSATGHNYVPFVHAPSYCTIDGYQRYRCSRCGDEYNEVIPATGHQFEISKITTPATCMEPGERTYTCRTCYATYSEVIPATEHWYLSISGLEQSCARYCCWCGAEEETNPEYTEILPSEIVATVEGELSAGTTVSGALIDDDKLAIRIEQDTALREETGSIRLTAKEYPLYNVSYIVTDKEASLRDTIEITSEEGLTDLTISSAKNQVTILENQEKLSISTVSRLDNGGFLLESESGTDILITAGVSLKGTLSKPLVAQTLTFEKLPAESEREEDDWVWVSLDPDFNNKNTGTRQKNNTTTFNDSICLQAGSATPTEPVMEAPTEPTEPATELATEPTEPAIEPATEPTDATEPAEKEETVTYVEIVFSTKTLTEEPEEDEEQTIISFDDTEDLTINAYDDTQIITIVPFIDATEPPTEPPTEPTVQEIHFNFTETKFACEKCGKGFVQEGNEALCPSCRNKCVPTGTLITLADGTLKPVEQITMDDLCLVFDHDTGTYTAAPINFIEDNGDDLYTVVHLSFSDGSTTALIAEHGYFDLDEMCYVYLREDNYTDYIGHRFYKATYENGVYTASEAVLTGGWVAQELTGSYAIPTRYHLNYFVDGYLSMSGFSGGMFNIFPYDADLKYNEEAKAADLAAYGLFAYENLADYITYEEYCQYPAQYLNVSIAKGLITRERLLDLIERYIYPYR